MTIPVGYAQITHHLTGANLPHGGAVVYGVSNTTLANALAVASLAHAAFGSNMMVPLTNDVSCSQTTCKLGPDDTGPMSTYTGTTFTGAVGSESSPPNVAYLGTKNTDLGGRRGRGRVFLPGVYEPSVSDGGVIGGSQLTALATGSTGWLDDLTVDGIPMYLLHGPETEWVLNSNGQPRRVPVAGAIPDPTLVVSISWSSLASTQRRRLR